MTLTVNTYEELRNYAAAFANGYLNLLIIVGSGGTAKTRTMKKIMTELQSGRVLEGSLTPFAFYHELKRWAGAPILIDDVDKLYRDPAAVRILKQVTQTEEERTVSWHSSKMDEAEREFQTSSPICLVFNTFSLDNADLAAVADRGMVLEFKPSAHEIHAETLGWFFDTEIQEFIYDHLEIIPNHSMRSYNVAAGLKGAKIDWRAALLSTWHINKDVAELFRVCRDDSLEKNSDRCREWVKSTGKDSTTFYRLCKEFPQISKTRATKGHADAGDSKKLAAARQAAYRARKAQKEEVK